MRAIEIINLNDRQWAEGETIMALALTKIKISHRCGGIAACVFLFCLVWLAYGAKPSSAAPPRTIAGALEKLAAATADSAGVSNSKLEFVHATYSGANRNFDAQFRSNATIIRGRIAADGKITLSERAEAKQERVASWQTAPNLKKIPDLDTLLTEAEKKVRADGYQPTGVALLKFYHRADTRSVGEWLAKTQVLFAVNQTTTARVVEFSGSTLVSHEPGTLLQITLPVVRTPEISNPKSGRLDFDIPEFRSSSIDIFRTTSNETIIRLQDDILFAFDADQPLPEAKPILSRLAKWLIEENPSLITITGHTDSWGTPQYNDDLSKRRAAAIAQDLQAAGVPGKDFVVKGYGESRPIAAEVNADGSDNADGRQRNRRVELRFRK